MKKGLFGGSFDPIHLGHLRCAEEIREIFDLDEIFFIPAGRQPLKADREATPFNHRAAMVRLAIEGNPHFTLSETENRRDGMSYSIDTVREFLEGRGSQGKWEPYFIMGQDAFEDITLWRDWEDLLKLCNIVVMTRPGFSFPHIEEILPPETATLYRFDDSKQCFRGEKGTSIFFRRLTELEISSTDIRNRRAEGKSIRYLVPEKVFDYIESKGLYRTEG